MNLHEYTRVLTRLINTPLLVEGGKWEIITENVTTKLLSGISLEKAISTESKIPQASSYPIIPVYDSLVSKNGAGLSGFTSYQGIKNQIMKMINEGESKIGFDFSTPGGELAGLEPLAELIQSLPTKYGVETFGFTEDLAASAGYWLISSTQKVYATKLAELGSIGAIVTLVDRTEADAIAGIKYKIMRSKEEKALGNPHEPISKALIENVQKKLDFADNLFNTSVNRYRPQVSLQNIIDLKGKTVFAEEALSIGLIDNIVTGLEEVISLEFPKKKISSFSSLNLTSEKNMNLEEAKERISALETSLKEVENKVSTATQYERTRCIEIIKAGTTLGVSLDTISARIGKGTSVEDSTELFTAVKEEFDKMKVISTIPVSGSGTLPSEVLNLKSKQQSQQSQPKEHVFAFGMNLDNLIGLKTGE